mmetsp:Transcript_76414/g.115016  ORF Transcript_76414/g.115016 Transcript_76414/m.115016 type:complete len:757 (+) Transcript_76414:47-2317(+)
MASFANFMGNNSYQVDAKAQEDKLREKEPLLLEPRETIELAFKDGRDGRDKSYFTSHRILIKNGKGVGGVRKNFKTIPYSSLEGFSCTTGGGVFDDDVEVNVWGTGATHALNLAKGSIDIFSVQQFLSAKILVHYKAEGTQDEIIPSSTKQAGPMSGFMSFFTGDAHEFEPKDIEEKFKTETPVLLQNETVDMAFKTGRDFLVFTSLRLFIVDVQGLMGKRIKFESILWSTISAISVQTSGGLLDRDTELVLHTHIHGKPKIEVTFRKNKTDIFTVKKCIAQKLFGDDDAPIEGLDLKESSWNPGQWFGGFDDNKAVDPAAVNETFHTEVPILQGCEQVELAFKAGRDMVIFTQKRILLVDPKGIFGRKTEYFSIPYKTILAFGVKTANGLGDRDAELEIWTDMMPEQDDKGEAVKPGMSYFELDFNKSVVDIIGLKNYVSQRCLKALKVEAAPTLSPNVDMGSNETKMGNFFSTFGDNQRPVDPEEVNTELHTETPILLEEESIVMAFRAGRDLTLFTSMRIVIVDVQGWRSQKVCYTSVPYTSIRAFQCESAGGWDADSELDIYTRNMWTMKKLDLDFKKGKVDILAIHRYVSAMVLGDADEQAKYYDHSGASVQVGTKSGIGGFVAWLGGDSVEQDTAVTDVTLHTDPPILMSEERVQKCYKSGRDLFVYTTHRVLLVDVQGLRGKKCAYLTVPTKWIKVFEVETAGRMDRDAEVYLQCDIPEKTQIKQEILVKSADIMDLQQYWTKELLFEL